MMRTETRRPSPTATTVSAARGTVAAVDTTQSCPTPGPVTQLTCLPADLSAAPIDLHHEAIDRRPSALCRHLDSYLGAVARELQARGVLTCAPQRTDPAHRLLGSIVLDCTALRVTDWASTDQPSPADQTLGDPAPGKESQATESLGGALHPGRPAPVIATWDEHEGWCVGLHHDPTHSSRRYLHPDLFPAAHVVADFVVGLALGRPLGTDRPISAAGPDRPQLHVLA